MSTRRTQVAARSLMALTPALAVSLALPGCQRELAISTGPAMTAVAPVDVPGLHNLVAFHDGVWSGSQPQDPVGFESLRAMGVKTVISVDGAKPNVAAAEARGLRYIHLPVGYQGFSDARRLELARALRDARAGGPVYIHCHHGKHRSAGAAGAAAVTLGWATPEVMVARMKVSGCSPRYPGLYRATQTATPAEPATLDAIRADFPSVAPPSGFIESMVEAEEIMEHLRLIERAGWRVPAEHPDLVPAAEAARLGEVFRAHRHTAEVRDRPAAFGALWDESGERARRIEEMYIADRPPAELSAELVRLTKSCNDCHAQFRDTPTARMDFPGSAMYAVGR